MHFFAFFDFNKFVFFLRFFVCFFSVLFFLRVHAPPPDPNAESAERLLARATGVLYSEAQMHAKAVYFYQMALHFNPNNSRALNNLGITYKNLDNMERSVECFTRCLEVSDPSLPRTPYLCKCVACAFSSQLSCNPITIPESSLGLGKDIVITFLKNVPFENAKCHHMLLSKNIDESI